MLGGTFPRSAASIRDTMSSSTAEEVTTWTCSETMLLVFPSFTTKVITCAPTENGRETLTPVAKGVVEDSSQKYCNASFSGSVEREASRMIVALELFTASTARQLVHDGTGYRGATVNLATGALF